MNFLVRVVKSGASDELGSVAYDNPARRSLHRDIHAEPTVIVEHANRDNVRYPVELAEDDCGEDGAVHTEWRHVHMHWTCRPCQVRALRALIDDAFDLAAAEVEGAGCGALAVTSVVPGPRRPLLAWRFGQRGWYIVLHDPQVVVRVRARPHGLSASGQRELAQRWRQHSWEARTSVSGQSTTQMPGSARMPRTTAHQ
jgi:hypothetical protein